jgi:ATP-dependent RNA helicase MSS116
MRGCFPFHRARESWSFVHRNLRSLQNGQSYKKCQVLQYHSFSELDISAPSRRALAEVFKYDKMTEVQAETLPLILEGTDCLAKAKTGTGKTLAFMIPTIERMFARKDHSASDICCLVISPARELASQISTETKKLLTFQEKNLQKVVTCVGGTNMKTDLKNLRGLTPIVVGTPGRLIDLLENQGLAQRMANLDSLILDEADQLLDMGFRPDIERILRLIAPSQKTRQTLLFSATVPASVSEIAGIALRPKYNFVDTVGEDTEQTHLHVQQQLIVTPQEKQMLALATILDRETSQKPYKIMVFFTTARLTGFMAELFNSITKKTGYKVLEIHSRKSQKQREKASKEFRDAKNAVMFSSDVSARGMDYPDVSFVLQVGLTDRSQYIHRLGRTARAGKEGKGALLLTTHEEHHMVQTELVGMPLETTSIAETHKQVGAVAVAQALKNVNQEKSLKLSAEQAYRAWLGYYCSSLKKVKWDKRQLVVQGNLWAKENGLKYQPTLQKRTIGKMGLKGVPGLEIEMESTDDTGRPPRPASRRR